MKESRVGPGGEGVSEEQLQVGGGVAQDRGLPSQHGADLHLAGACPRAPCPSSPALKGMHAFCQA